MYRFWATYTYPLLQQRAPRVIIEVGSFHGKGTRLLLDYCRQQNATLHAIDPLPRFDVTAWQAEYGSHFVMHAARSLDVLRQIEPADVVLIDGDHNWYTVYHELKQLAEIAQQSDRLFPIVLFHDVGWPYARRDLYYNPADIPAQFRHPFQVNGIVPGEQRLRRHGFNYDLANAKHEGGPRNGVLTAIEDFVEEYDQPLELVLIPGFSGFGILYPTALTDQAPALKLHVDQLSAMNLKLNDFLAALEHDRIHGYAAWLRTARQLSKCTAANVAAAPPADT